MTPKRRKHEQNALVGKVMPLLRSRFQFALDYEQPSPVHDVVSYLTLESSTGDIVNKLSKLEARVQSLDKGWPLHNRITHSPNWVSANERREGIKFFVSPSQLGVSENHSLKGSSKTWAILDIAQSFAERPYNSRYNPLQLLMPQTKSGSQIEPLSMRHAIGFGRSLAAKLLLLGVVELKLADVELVHILPQLQSLLLMWATYRPQVNAVMQVKKTLSRKLASWNRPDVLQMYRAFMEQAEDEKVIMTDVLSPST